MSDDAGHMAHALRLAARGLGNVWPNPAVGCVIVRDDRVVGRGWTQPGGRPHAEPVALAQAGPVARGATAYVTLEPCAHHGRTPPCAEALVAAGVARVVTALTDPDPRVSGRGHAILRGAGIAVTEGVLTAEAREMNAGFLSRVVRGRPWVTLKFGLSLDGRIANAAGESRWITGPVARRMVHAQRASHDAVMVGIGTALADDPDLTVRELGVRHQPLRVVLDSRLRLPPTARLLQRPDVPVWVLHDEAADPARAEALMRAGAVLVPVPGAGRLDAAAALSVLGARGLTRVFCEGGGELAASLIRADLADEVIAFSAGHVLGAAGTPAIGALPPLPLSPRWRLAEVLPAGPDLMHRWQLI